MSDTSDFHDKATDLKARIKQITQPIVDSLDTRLSAQVDKRVDQRVEETMKDRLAVLERAVADLGRTVQNLEARLQQHDEDAKGSGKSGGKG